jgi:CBS domain-containing protein
MTAARIISEKGREVFTVSPDASLIDAARTLTEHKVGAAVVVNGGHEPVGVFSERDLARAVAAEGAAALSETVSTVMSTRLVTATPSATIDELMGQMTDRRVRHVLIVEEGALAGVVSIGDVVKRKIATAEAEAESLKAYIEGV